MRKEICGGREKKVIDEDVGRTGPVVRPDWSNLVNREATPCSV